MVGCGEGKDNLVPSCWIWIDKNFFILICVPYIYKLSISDFIFKMSGVIEGLWFQYKEFNLAA